MANNIFCGARLVSTGAFVSVRATDTGGVYTIDAAADGEGDASIIIPGVVQAANQNLAAPLMVKNNGDGTVSLVVASA